MEDGFCRWQVVDVDSRDDDKVRSGVDGDGEMPVVDVDRREEST